MAPRRGKMCASFTGAHRSEWCRDTAWSDARFLERSRRVKTGMRKKVSVHRESHNMTESLMVRHGGEALAGGHKGLYDRSSLHGRHILHITFSPCAEHSPLHRGPASRGILSSLVRGEATDCRPEAQRWMICSGRVIAVNYYGKGMCGTRATSRAEGACAIGTKSSQ